MLLYFNDLDFLYKVQPIQIGAVAANSRCFQRQRLIKRMNSNVMAASDNDKLKARLFGA